MDHTEEIKARIPIEELVSDYVQIRKAGRNFKALCPFHNDKHPSFLISPEKGIAWCFSCQSGGDIFSFLQQIEKIDFPEALKILAERAGVQLPEFSKEKKTDKIHIQDILESVSSFYKEEFKDSKKAQEYWKTREISSEITNLFEIGYAPDSFTKTFDYLKKQKFTPEAIIKAGISIEKDEKKGEFFDRFRDRLIIPIKNHLGKIIGFGGRLIENKKDEAKYLNSPETSLYNKSYVLYGLDKAKESIKKENCAIILEGYMDVIASHQAEVKNVVAVSGTALTDQQLKLLKRYTNTLKLCFDQDNAGREATKRSIELAAEQDFNIEIIIIENAKDTDELIKKDPNLWKQAITETISPLDFFILEAESRYNINDIVQQKEFISEVLNRIKVFSNKVVQNNYAKILSEKCNLDLRILLEELRKVKLNRYETKESENIKINNELITAEKYLLGIIGSTPECLEYVSENLIFQIFKDMETKDIYKKLLENYNEEVISSKNYEVFCTPEEKEKIKIWSLYTEEKNTELNKEDWQKECVKVVKNLNIQNLKKEEKNIAQKMKDQNLPKEESQRLALQIMEINKLKSKIYK